MKIGLQSWGSEGDMQPFLALAAGLVAAGHEVTLVTADNANRDYRPYAERYGFALRSLTNERTLSEREALALWRRLIAERNPLRQAELIMRHGFDPQSEAMFEAASQLCRDHDAVVGHFLLFPLQVAAEQAGIPLATLNVVHSCVPSAHLRPAGLPDFGRWFYPLGWKALRWGINRVFLPRINRLRRREGLTELGDAMGESWCSPRLNLLAVSPSICPPPEDWHGRHHVCGFFNLPPADSPEQPPDGLLDFLAAGAPPVYFTFGSMMMESIDDVSEVLSLWRETVRRLGCRAVFQTPWPQPCAEEPDIFCLRRSPYRQIFPLCSAIVHHGGAGTTQSSLLAGRPSVVVAHLADQFFWGKELQRLGVAGRSRRRSTVTPAALAGSLSEVLRDPAVAQRAQRLGAAMAAENGVAQAVRLIEQRLLRAIP